MARHIQRSSLPIAALFVLLLFQMPDLHAQQVMNDGVPSLDDLLQAEQLASQCLGMDIAVDSNQASRLGNRMVVAFQPHESGPGLQRFFVVIFNRPDENAEWQVQLPRPHAGQYLDDGSGVHVTGLLAGATVELLYESVAELWKTAAGPDFTITTINTTRMPEFNCEIPNLPQVDGVWHEVMVAAQQLPDEPGLPRYLSEVGLFVMTMEIDRDLASNYKFTFMEGPGGYPEFVKVDCVRQPIPCPAMETLQTALGITADQDHTQRDEAILAVLPPEYSGNHSGDMQTVTGNGRENLTIQLEPAAVSPVRSVRAMVNCRRPLGSGGDWSCEYRFLHYDQTLSNGIVAMVRTLDLSEGQVETMVAKVNVDIVNAIRITISQRESEFVLNYMGPGPGVTAIFDASLNLTGEEITDR